MEPFACLAIDMGAGSIRIVQGTFGETFSMKEVHRFENSIEHRDGADRWNLKHITNGILEGISRAITQSDVPVKSVGVDSWGVDFVLLDSDGELLEDPVSYRDERTSGMKYLWNTMMPEMGTFRHTGINYNVFNSLYQLLSLKGSEVMNRTHRILFMADYINYLLSGIAVNELTLASTTQMLSCATGDWDPEILKLLEIRPGLLEKPVLPGMRIGFLKNGLVGGAPDVVAVAGHDTACAVAAIPGASQNPAFLSTGTWCIMGMVTDKPLLSEQAFNMGITNERTADGRFRPLKNIMGLWLIQQLRLAFGSKHSFAAIDDMAAKVASPNLLVDPSDSLFFNPPDMKLAFDEYLMRVYGRKLQSEADYYRCAYESLAAAFRETLLELEILRGKSFDSIHVIGGGAQSDLLCQLTANITGKQVIAGPVEAAVTGNLLIQVAAAGNFKRGEEAKKQIFKSMRVQNYFPR